MTLNNCLSNKIKQGTISSVKGKKAQQAFQTASTALIQQGIPPTQAYALAAQSVATQTKQAAAASKHRLLGRYATMRNLQNVVATSKKPTSIASDMMDQIEFDVRSLRETANNRMQAFLMKFNGGLMGNNPDPMSFDQFHKALNGEPVNDPVAKAMAAAYQDVEEWYRVEMNARGYNIGKLDNRGVPHDHDPWVISQDKDAWKKDINAELDWMGVIDHRTGAPFVAMPSAAEKDAFLEFVYQNIVYGRDSDNPTWGLTTGGKGLERRRILKFRNTEAWGRYNAKYGSSDPLSAVMHHLDHMAHELAIARHLGAEPDAAMNYLGKLVANRARKEGWSLARAKKAEGDMGVANRMMKMLRPAMTPPTEAARVWARRMSNTRKGLTAALLDRAVVISIPSDINSAMMAAQLIGMNETNFLSTYMKLWKDSLSGGGSTRDALLTIGHVAETYASPNATMDRYQQEFPASVLIDRVTNGVMQVSGLAAHTANIKLAVKGSLAGHLASIRNSAWDKLNPNLRGSMESRGIAQADWDMFRNSGGLFQSQNGATLLDPVFWRENNTMQNVDEAMDLYMKMQGWVEYMTEQSVPSGRNRAKAYIDPQAYATPENKMAPGTPFYELVKSMGMFKSFLGAYIINQLERVAMTQTHRGLKGTAAKAGYVVEMVARTTIVGALALQVGDMLMGRDPQPMDNQEYWTRALLRGGGLGPVGDLITIGTAQYGGGWGGYIGGPVASLATDAGKLGFGALAVGYRALLGMEQDDNFPSDVAKFISRYTPGMQMPIWAGGAALDRMVVDQLLLMLDPDAIDGMVRADKRRETDIGSGVFWPRGEPLPVRAPDLGAILSP